jgi:hypothetical protein
MGFTLLLTPAAKDARHLPHHQGYGNPHSRCLAIHRDYRIGKVGERRGARGLGPWAFVNLVSLTRINRAGTLTFVCDVRWLVVILRLSKFA